MEDYEERDTIDQADIDAVVNALFGNDAAPSPEPPAGPFSGGFSPSAEPVAVASPEPTSSTGVGFSGSFAPYAIPDMRDDPGGRRMEAALGMVRDLFGVTEQGGQPGTAGGAYRDDWERRNTGRNFDDTVVDYGRTGIDTSQMERGGLPVQRVIALSGKELSGEPFRNYGDIRSVPGSVVRRDANGEPLLDEQGRAQRYDLPGYNGQQRFGPGLREDRLENGQRVFYDQFNNLTYGARDGQPDRLLPGGMGYQGGASGGAYGLTPTTDRAGRPVWWEGEQGNRTFERSGDKVGRNVAMPPPTGGRGSNLGWMNPPDGTGNDQTLLTTSDGLRVVIHANGGAYLYNPDGTVQQKLNSQDAVDKAVAYLRQRDANGEIGRSRYDEEIARQGWDYQLGTANVPPPAPPKPVSDWSAQAQAGGSSVTRPVLPPGSRVDENGNVWNSYGELIARVQNGVVEFVGGAAGGAAGLAGETAATQQRNFGTIGGAVSGAAQGVGGAIGSAAEEFGRGYERGKRR